MTCTVQDILALQDELFTRAQDLVEAKGHDYNGRQQEAGDTLFNMRVAATLGIVDSNTKSVLVRLGDKFMRLISLADPTVLPAVKDESVKDTVVDVINYVTYYYRFWLEARDEAKQEAEASDRRLDGGPGEDLGRC